MAFAEDRFPTDIAYGAIGGPQFQTDIIVTHSGYEQRNANWSQPRSTYNVSHGIKTQQQLDTLIAFFRARRGRADGFRFKDWSDYKATGALIGTGNGTQTQFKLQKQYISTVTVNRMITKPVTGTVYIYMDGIMQTSGYNINYTTGVVTFTAAPANGVALTADFEFDVPVRFDTDQLAASLDAYGIRSWNDIPLVEIRL